MPEHVTIPAPHVPFPGGRTDADFMRSAADHLERGYPVGGSNLTATVIRLLRDVAMALDGQTAATGQPRDQALRALAADWQANGNSRELGDPRAGVWDKAARQLLDALDATPPSAETLPLSVVLSQWRVGSHEWTWDEEFADLWTRDEAALDLLATSVQETGMREPVQLGGDGRVWDGHHRLAVAVVLGLEHVPVEFAHVPSAGEEFREAVRSAVAEYRAELDDARTGLVREARVILAGAKLANDVDAALARPARETPSILPGAKFNLDHLEGVALLADHSA